MCALGKRHEVVERTDWHINTVMVFQSRSSRYRKLRIHIEIDIRRRKMM
jgi:hypothetical protein